MATQQKLPSKGSIGLLTTVSDLPPDYKSLYPAIKRQAEIPLDLSVKHSFSTITPPTTPIASPLKKRYRGENEENQNNNSADVVKTELILTIQKEVTPQKAIKTVSVNRNSKKLPASPAVTSSTRVAKEKKSKTARKLKFDEDTSSPVSGTIIRSLEEINASGEPQESGDIDPEYNIVEVTEEAKAELEAIPNVIGAYICKLCRLEFEDAFGLARHRCTCIVLLEYRCPECGKRFNSPANLASHRRWHKPRDQMTKKSESSESDLQYPCLKCGKLFKRQAYLKKHLATHKNSSNSESSGNNNNDVSNSNNISSPSIQSDDYNSKDSSDIQNNNNDNDSDKNSNLPQTVFKYESTDMEMLQDDYENSSSSIGSSLNSINMISNRFTEDENIAAAALAHLRNGVIRHTTSAVTV